MVKVSDGTRSYEARSQIIDDSVVGDSVVMFFRPEDTIVTTNVEKQDMNTFQETISALVYLGNYVDCRISLGATEIRAQVSNIEHLKVNDKMVITVDPHNCVCLRK